MDLAVQSLDGSTYVIDVGVDDTTEDVRRKVASAAGLSEDSFEMSVGGSGAGEDIVITQLSAGDTIFLTPSKKHEAIAMLHALGETDLTAARLSCVTDPEVACLLLQAGVATVTPWLFLTQATLQTLDLSSAPYVREIGNDFLYSCEEATSLDLSGLGGVQKIGNCFLSKCRALRTLDLSALRSVSKMGSGFLSDCEALERLDVSGFGRIRLIANGFLSGCESLTKIDLSALSSVKYIGDCVLYDCTSLTYVDLSGLRSVVRIGARFLYNCAALEVLDMADLRSVTQVGNAFLGGCVALTALDLSGLGNVASIGRAFAADSEHLLCNVSALCNAKHIEDDFLRLSSAETLLSDDFARVTNSAVTDAVRSSASMQARLNHIPEYY